MTQHSKLFGRGRLACALVPCLAIFLAGCAADQYRRLPDPTPITYDREPLVKVMEEMDARRFAVSSLGVRLRIVLRDQVKAKDYGLNGAYLGDKDGNIRLIIRYKESTILDLAMYGDKVELALPRKDRYFRGTRKDLLEAEDCELSLFAYAGNMHDLFFPRAWTEDAIERRAQFEQGHEVVKVVERPGIFKRTARKVFISLAQPVAEKVEIYSMKEKLVGHFEYDDYRFSQPRAGEASQTPPYPGRVVLKSENGTRELQMDVEEMRPDIPVPVNRFEIEIPEGQKIMDLGEYLSSGKSLWE